MNRVFSAVGVAAVAMVTLAGAVIAGPGFNNKYSPDPVTVECNDSNGDKVGEVRYDGPQTMWPPNHKYQDITITATAEDPDDTVTLETEGTHDEYAEDDSEFNGAGNTDNDVNPVMDSDVGTGSAQTAHDIRSERSGLGEGRTYTIDWQATFTDGDGNEAVCASTGFDGEEDAFAIVVPHDMKCGAGWKTTGKSKDKCAA